MNKVLIAVSILATSLALAGNKPFAAITVNGITRVYLAESEPYDVHGGMFTVNPDGSVVTNWEPAVAAAKKRVFIDSNGDPLPEGDTSMWKTFELPPAGQTTFLTIKVKNPETKVPGFKSIFIDHTGTIVSNVTVYLSRSGIWCNAWSPHKSAQENADICESNPRESRSPDLNANTLKSVMGRVRAEVAKARNLSHRRKAAAAKLGTDPENVSAELVLKADTLVGVREAPKDARDEALQAARDELIDAYDAVKKALLEKAKATNRKYFEVSEDDIDPILVSRLRDAEQALTEIKATPKPGWTIAEPDPPGFVPIWKQERQKRINQRRKGSAIKTR